MTNFTSNLDAFGTSEAIDPRELFAMSAVQDFRNAAGDLLRAGFTENDLAALIEESLPIAEEIDAEPIPANLPF